MRRGAKIWITVGTLVVVGLGVGGWYGTHLVKQKVADEVVQTLNSPETQQQIQKILASNGINSDLTSNAQSGAGNNSTSSGSGTNQSRSNSTNPTPPGNGASKPTVTVGNGRTAQTGKTSGKTTNTSPIAFQNRQAVITFAMSRFSTGEIAHFLSLWAHRSSLSSSQKEQIKNEILSRFTPAELAAMVQAINK